MSSEYSYDEQGQFFPFYILTIVALITLPLTYGLLAPSTDAAATATRIQTDYKAPDAELVAKLRQAQKRRQRKIKRIVFVVIGWLVMALMVYLIMVRARTTTKIWNPYDILGISESASEKQIKSRYKELSRKFHPDKVKPDPSKNETMETLNARYVEISKAYQALTDEEVRNNYIQYGHPDGKQSFSIGIALPKFIIAEGNDKYVVLVYAMLLGVLLPYLVGSWWYGTQRISKEGVLIESANQLFREYRDDIDEGGIVTALSSGKEYDAVLGRGDKAESDLAKVESKILADGETTPFACGMTVKDKEKLEDLEGGVRRKALALLWAYLGRVDLGDPALEEAKYEMGPIAHALSQSFLVIAQCYGNTAPILAAYGTCQRLVQAIPPSGSPLLQLPHFTHAIAKAIEGDSKTHYTVQKFMDLPDSMRRSLAVGPGLLTDAQYKTAVATARQLPYFRVAKAFFKVAGERFIIPSSLVTLVIKGRFVPPASTDVPEIDPLELEDVDPAEDDLDAILGRKKAKLVKGPDGKPIKVSTSAKDADAQPVRPPLAFAPRFARDHSPKWFVFLTDSKQGRMAVPPFTFQTFDRPIFDAEGNATFNVQTLKAQFAAPPNPGHYTFVMHVICDSYVGFDTKMEVTLVVDDASKAAAVAAEDEISEPDEDSLAGQMEALRGGNTRPRRRKPPVEESSDEESTTDGEASDTSETNTDTEPES